MKKKMIFMPFLFLGIMALVIWVLMTLWNWLMPMVFDLMEINFWQAAGLLIISKILFGGFNSCKKKEHCCKGSHTHAWKEKFKNKWKNMPENEKNHWEGKFAKVASCEVDNGKNEDDLNTDN